MKNPSHSIPVDLFTELASESRCELIERIRDQSLTQTQISKEVGMTIQETHRQVSRLLAANIIEKDTYGGICLTQYGNLIAKQMTNFQTLAKFNKFFDTHDLEDLPEKSYNTIGCLSRCKLVDSVTAGLEVLKSALSESHDYLKVVAYETFGVFDEQVLEKIHAGMKIDYVYGKNTQVPKSSDNEEQAKKLISQGSIKRRMVDHVGISVLITEKYAGIMFPHKDGSTDVSYMFFGEDEEFRLWCLSIFYSIWDSGKTFDIKKLKN